MYRDDNTWKVLQPLLPCEIRISEENTPIEEYVRIEQFRIHIDRYVPKSMTDVCAVVFHGVGGNGRLLSFLATPLVASGIEVVCPDMPGYGFTECKKYPTYDDWINVGHQIVESILSKKKRVFLIGLSAGGMLAYNVACKSDRISGLIITNILDNRLKVVREYSAKNKFQANIGLYFLNHMPSFIKKICIPISMVTNMNGLVNDKAILTVLKKDRRGAGSRVQIGFLLSMMKSIPILEPEDFKKIPVMMCHPGEDKWTPVQISKLFFDRISSRKTEFLLENCGHFPIEQPGRRQLKQKIVEFINLTLPST